MTPTTAHLTETETAELTAILRRHGLSATIQAIADYAATKADEAYQDIDKTTARSWATDAGRLDHVAETTAN